MRNNSYLCSMNAAMKMTALMAALLLSWCLSAQETTRKAYGVKSDFSLVWEMYPNQRWVVFNKYAVASYFNFGYINSSGTNTFFSTAQDIDVKDIYVGGDVYFCGSIFDSVTMTDVGIWGYFPLSGMPTPTVTCFLVDSMECLNKLEFYQTQWQKHVVMIGTGKNGHDYILDASYELEPMFSTGWTLDRTRIPNVEARFHDIDVISGKVVVSGVIQISSSPVISTPHLFYIDQSPLAPGPFFGSSSIVWRELPGTNSSKILIQNSLVDTLYVVYRNASYLYICQMNGTSLVSVKKMQLPMYYAGFGNIQTGSFIDLKADISYKNLNLLLSVPTASNIKYMIYHVPLIGFASASSAKVHSYTDGSILNSLGRSKNHTATAVGNQGEWCLFKVDDNTAGNCTVFSSVSLSTPSIEIESHPDQNHTDETLVTREIVMPVTPRTVTITTICQ